MNFPGGLVSREENGYLRVSVVRKLVGQLSSNWKQLDPESRKDSKKIDYWASWQKRTDWTHAGKYGIGQNIPYEQKLIEYGEEMPPPDGGDQGDNKKLSWAFKRDYETSWLNPQTPLTSADWWNANQPTWYKPKYNWPLTMDSVLCAVNHFNQGNVYKLPGVKVKSDGTPIGVQKEYNAYCKRTNQGGMAPPAWGVDFTMGRCLIRFQNSASSSSGTSKRDAQKWGEWEVESIEYVEDVDDAEMAQLLKPADLDGSEHER
ncbi:hypothetical protein CBS147325_3460 [Penicillium roqueforti]|nr:hypothetical protein CBS147325_3460 [Penicillium roqueforti]